jgi:hypothetical protein
MTWIFSDRYNISSMKHEHDMHTDTSTPIIIEKNDIISVIISVGVGTDTTNLRNVYVL